MDYEDYCGKQYNRLYKKYYNHYEKAHRGKNLQKNAELYAQKKAIEKSFIAATSTYSDVDPALLWRAIEIAHMRRKTRYGKRVIVDDSLIADINSAAQSWKKSSGHAFEELICDTVNPELEKSNIKIVLQKDLTKMLKQNQISNSTKVIEWLHSKTTRNTFDLFAVLIHEDDKYVFGCVQSKTSIRDRVGRDYPFSKEAMENRLWSAAITLDGDFLTLPKFKGMVNGGFSDYRENGWHGMYVLSGIETAGRIFHMDRNFDVFIKHTIEASKSAVFAKDEFDHTWTPTT